MSRSILALQAHLIRTAVDPDELWQRARGRLLAAPNLTAAQVRSAGQDPGRADLIRLSDADGRIRLPAFQFDAAGCPLRLVLEINHTLDADGDPWGAADWWLCPNAWLSAVPCEVLGIVDDELLRATARAEVGV